MPSLALTIDLLSAICCLFAFWKGGAAERAAAAAVAVNLLIGQAGHLLAPELNSEIRLVNDGLAALILLAVTVRYATLWMGAVMPRSSPCTPTTSSWSAGRTTSTR